MTQSVLVLARPGTRAQALETCAARLGEGWRIRSFVSDSPEPALGPWPDLILLDLPDDDAISAVRAVAQQFEATPLVASGPADDDGSIESVLREGALSYLPRGYTAEQALLVLRLATEGIGHRPNLVSRRTAGEPAGAIGDALRDLRLTPKQVEVLSYAAEGLSNKQIAARVGISVGTVKLHMTEIYRRLDVERRGEAIAKAHTLERVRAQQMRHGENGKDVLEWLLPHVSHRRVPAGEVIFRLGDPGTELYYLQRGRVLLEEIGVEMGAGDMFGEIGVFAPNRARTCTARCLTDVDLFCLSSDQARSIYYLNPRFALHLITLVAQRLLADRDRGG